MIVLDASVTVDWLLRAPHARLVDALLLERDQTVGVPHLWSVEVTQVLRRFERVGELPSERADLARASLGQLRATRYAHEPLLGRAWQLRRNVTAYDGVYLALAEALDAPLVTSDAKLARVPGCTAAVQVVGGAE